MDLTQQFKASVMTVRLQRKSELANNKTQEKQRKVSTTKGGALLRDDFALQAKDVCSKITNLRNVLIENRTAYMRIGQHLKNASHMTDTERDLIDRESEKFVTYYTQHLAKMRSDWKSAKRKPQEHVHIEAVLDLLVKYLQVVEQIYVQQKKYRVQHELETYRLLKLAADKKKVPVRPADANSGKLANRQLSNGCSQQTDEETDAAQQSEEDAAEDWGNESWGDWDNDNDTKEPPAEESTNKPRMRKRSRVAATESSISKQGDSSAKVALDEELQRSAQQQANDEDDALSAEDVQLFEAENVHIYNMLQGVSEEVERIERNVVDIAQLQDIFTEKVVMQQHNIDRIVNAVVGATENVKDANEHIRQATQRNAGLRVWSLFFLLVMSFSLLFLDWYYD